MLGNLFNFSVCLQLASMGHGDSGSHAMWSVVTVLSGAQGE